ncbi:MAG: flagellar motor protein MotB [Alphaproteobacteria bacterium]|nr:flagellar motor protein MotB [Alphaproteobacteria bacterium]
MRIAATLCALLVLIDGSPARAVSPYNVFFASGRAKLNHQSGLILDNVAKTFRIARVRSFDVFGHADRAGSSDHNRWLSRRRAEAVKAALVARGVPARAIAVQAVGEARPLVETPDGVAERQNRRVEIIITCLEPPTEFDYMRCSN